MRARNTESLEVAVTKTFLFCVHPLCSATQPRDLLGGGAMGSTEVPKRCNGGMGHHGPAGGGAGDAGVTALSRSDDRCRQAETSSPV